MPSRSRRHFRCLMMERAHNVQAWLVAIVVYSLYCGVVVVVYTAGTLITSITPLYRFVSALSSRLSAGLSDLYSSLRHPSRGTRITAFLLQQYRYGIRALVGHANMTLKATKFTPEVLLTAPRRSAAAPSPDGTKALFTVSTYSFETHKKTAQIRVLDIASGQSTVLVDDTNASEPTWLSDDEFLYLKAGEKGATTLVVDNVSAPRSSL